MNDICWVIDVKPVWVYWMFLQGNRTWSCVHTPASASCSPLMSMDWGMLPTSMQDTCLGVFLKRSLGGANISWERKNFSGWVMGGRNPGHIYTSCVGHDALVVLLGNEYRAMPLLHTHTWQQLLRLLPGWRRVQQVGEHGGEWVCGQRFGAIHLPEQVEGGEPLRGAGQQVRLLEEHHQHRAHPEVFRFPEVMMEVGGEALEGVGAGLLRDDAQQVGQLLRGQRHGLTRRGSALWRSALLQNYNNSRYYGM